MLSHPRLKKMRGADFFVVNNGIPLSSISSILPPGNLTTQPFNHLDKTIVEFCQRGFTLGATGRLSSGKGFDILLDAVQKVVKTNPEVRLVILGEGGERGALETNQLGSWVGRPRYDAGLCSGCQTLPLPVSRIRHIFADRGSLRSSSKRCRRACQLYRPGLGVCLKFWKMARRVS